VAEYNTFWEPRVLWDLQRVDTSESEQIGGVVRQAFNRENFRNGGQYPIHLTHMLIAPVGYLLVEYDGQNDPPTDATGDVGACCAVLQRASLMISVPHRQHYSLLPLQIGGGWGLQPTGDVIMRDHPTIPWTTGLHNVCRWDFEKKLLLPRNAACMFQLGQFLNQPNDVVPVPTMNAYLAFHEGGGGHDGSQAFAWNQRARIQNLTLEGQPDPTSQFPFQPADGLGSIQVGNPPAFLWPSDSQMSFTQYKQQESARSGHNEVGGFAVAIDQIAYELAVQSSAITNVPDSWIASLALRIPCRARADWGSQEWWWREGMPLALACPTLGPAFVHRLPEPFELHPGDTIDVEMEVPGGRTTDNDDDVFSIWQTGVSFLGYAAVRG